MKANIRHRQKMPSFLLKSIYLYNLYLAALKTLSTRDGVILTFSFLDNTNFLENCSLIVIHFFAHYQGSALFEITINGIQND